ncbi:MAG: hypothetical protein LBO80_04890 [Treponema sp.]|jgi:hypothetical protein|nr:hypothetical protein [Treponema sp.]
MTVPPKPVISRNDENVVYFTLPEITLYYDGSEYRILSEGEVMELPTVYFEKELL